MYNLDPEKMQTTSTLDMYCKLGYLKKLPLKGKDKKVAQEVELGGDGRLFKYTRAKKIEIVAKATEDETAMKAEQNYITEGEMQDPCSRHAHKSDVIL